MGTNSCAPTAGSRASTPSRNSTATRSTTSKSWWPTSRPHRSRTPPAVKARRPAPRLSRPPPPPRYGTASARAPASCSRPTARSSRGSRPPAPTSRPASRFPSSTRRISPSTRRAAGVPPAAATAASFRGCWSRRRRGRRRSRGAPARVRHRFRDDVADSGQPCPECHGERLNRVGPRGAPPRSAETAAALPARTAAQHAGAAARSPSARSTSIAAAG
jgi:hypothetical protein